MHGNTVRSVWISLGITALSFAVFFFLCGCGKAVYEEGFGTEESAEFDTEKTEESGQTEVQNNRQEEETNVFVYVCGAVKTPGVYELEQGARVCDAVGAAGGLTEKAEASAVNQARVVTDGEQIYVPESSESESGVVDYEVTQGAELNGKVNINTAGKEELMTLTGIGEAKAESIIAYRTEHGSFARTEDLMLVEGIKEGVFHKIKDDIII